LVTGSYLKPSTRLSHISKTDRLLRFEAGLRKEHKGIPTAKDIVHWKIEAEAKVKREDEEAEKIGMVCYFSCLSGVSLLNIIFQKRKAKEQSNHRSKQVRAWMKGVTK